MSKEVTIEVWSDYVCPFCYLEEPVLEHLRHQEGESLRVQWHAFELRPEPVPTLEPKGNIYAIAGRVRSIRWPSGEA